MTNTKEFETGKIRRVGIIGGLRIPFCRSNTAYENQTNLDLASAAAKALVGRYDLKGKTLGDVAMGAVIKHSSDWNLTREVVLECGLAPQTPGFVVQRACGTSLDTTNLIASKIALGQMEVGIAGGTDTTSDVPVVFNKKFGRRLVDAGTARSMGERLKAFKGFSPGELAPSFPGVKEPRTGLSMGEHCELMAKEWDISRDAQDRLALASHQKAAAAFEQGFYDDLVAPHLGVEQDNILRPDTSLDKLSSLKPAFDKSGTGTLTAGNSTPLTDGASCALIASDDWAKANGHEIQAYLTYCKVSAVDYVAGEGLLMAPAHAVPQMLNDAGLTLDDFDFYEIHEAFAAQVLCTLKAWESDVWCQKNLGRKALGELDRDKLNVKGSSLALGHPFAATGTRIVSTAAKLLAEKGSGRCLISICTAGGMGVTAILER